ncbi:MAG: hypothetical protein NC898_01210, partial [Candidatus Omnitrophica bacterium]|nr:hypothetical protein [Candidatus Omnitrophota bacterium]
MKRVRKGVLFLFLGLFSGLILLKSGFSENKGLFSEEEVQKGYVKGQILVKLIPYLEEEIVFGLTEKGKSLPPALEKELK